MTENIDAMRKRHDCEIEELQKVCKHDDISEWIPFQWAPGHFSHWVRVCEFCEKTIKDSQNREDRDDTLEESIAVAFGKGGSHGIDG